MCRGPVDSRGRRRAVGAGAPGGERRGLRRPRDAGRHLRHGALPRARRDGWPASRPVAWRRSGSRRRTTGRPSTWSSRAALDGSSTRCTRRGSRSSAGTSRGTTSRQRDLRRARAMLRFRDPDRRPLRRGRARHRIAPREERHPPHGADARPPDPAARRGRRNAGRRDHVSAAGLRALSEAGGPGSRGRRSPRKWDAFVPMLYTGGGFKLQGLRRDLRVRRRAP